MSNMFNSNLQIKMEGVSHSKEMKIYINGFPKGVKVDNDFLKKELLRRKPDALLSNARIEEDEYEFLSGVTNNITNGKEIIIVVKNNNYHSNNYEYGLIRPSHADYPAYIKYGKDYDYRGGGQFSGRLTALTVIAGALCKEALKKYNVNIASHIKQIGNIKDHNLDYSEKEINCLNNHLMIDEKALGQVNDLIKKTKEDGDSIGGAIEAYATGVKVGLGEDYFGGLEAKMASLMFSIPGAKAVSFGNGQDFASEFGSSVNDELAYIDGNVKILSNNAGGINGGLSNGNPIVCTVIFRPTSSIKKSQRSINIDTKTNINLQINGNHDACFAYRCGVIVEGMLAISLLDSYLGDNC